VSARISQKVAVGVVFAAAMFMSIMDATIVACSLSIRDADAAATIPGRPGPDAAQSAPAPSATA
jgi:hypothetical protein